MDGAPTRICAISTSSPRPPTVPATTPTSSGGENGVAIIDTVKENFSETFFRRLESVADWEITTIVLNHLEPDHSGALPELLKRAPRPRSICPAGRR